MAGRLQLCVIMGAALIVLCLMTCTAAQQSSTASMDAAAYQEKLFEKTLSMHPKQHSFNGHSGPWLENVFYKAWRSQKPTTSRIFIPVAWTDAMHVNSLKLHMQQLINQLSPRFKYFTVVQAGRGFQHPKLGLHVPSYLDILFFMAGGDSPPLRTVPVFLLKEELHPLGLSKSISVSSQCDMGNHAVRRALHEQYNSSYLFLKQSDDWRIVTESSNFSFCPRGFGPTSFRLYETLQVGTIPVYVWEEQKWLAFEDLIDWNKIAIIIESRDISQIASKIAEANVEGMQAAIAKYRHMFTYDFTIGYIFQRLAEETPVGPVKGSGLTSEGGLG
jgi:hypothetical protein